MNQDVQLTAYRYAVWGGPDGSEEIVYLGEDMTDAVLAWSFARTPGGEVQFTLENAPIGSQGLSMVYQADYLHPISGQTTGATIVMPQIDVATLESVSSLAAHGETVTLHHTLYVTRHDGFKHAELNGTMSIRQGAPN